MRFQVPEDRPDPVGAFLDDQEIMTVARVLYHRFYWSYGLRPSWFDTPAKYKEIKLKNIREVLDALSLCGFKIVPMAEGEERLPRPKQTDLDEPYEHNNVSESVLRTRDTD